MQAVISYHQTLQRFCYRHKEWTFSRYVKYGAHLLILLSILKPEHYSILIYTRDIPTPYKARALNTFFKNVRAFKCLKTRDVSIVLQSTLS